MYTEFFGLIEKPFNVTPDPRFLYLSANHQEALAAMLYGIKERRGMISIIGEVGTGKTTLLRALFNELEGDTETIYIFNTNVTFLELLKNILWELDIPFGKETKVELIQLLNQYLIAQLSAGSNVALIVDEAQNLSPDTLEEIRMLSNLETEREKLLQILLIGQPELLTKLNSPALRQLKQRIAISYFLEPLTFEDSMKYIAHRFSVAGSKNGKIFSPPAIELICRRSHGIPRIINMLCDNTLLAAYSRNQRHIDRHLVEESITDYEMSGVPALKARVGQSARGVVRKVAAPPAPRKHFSYRWPVIILIVFFTLVLTLLGISLSGNKLELFDWLAQLAGTFSWSVPVNTIPVQDQAVLTMPLQPVVTDESEESTITREEEIILPAGDLQGESPGHSDPLPPDQAPPPSDSIVIPTDPSPAQTMHKDVFARKNDMVSAIVVKEYGAVNDTILDLIKRVNPDIQDLDRISVGQKIVLPLFDIDSIILETADGHYTVHLQTFNSYANASGAFADSAWNEHPIVISPVMIAGQKTWYRVTVGNFTDREQAKELVQKIGFSNFPLLKKK